MLGGRVRIVDSNGNDLPPHEVGEILYRGENLMAGYWARADATAQSIRGGWFHTGDAGYVDEEGFIFLRTALRT
jgi:acyl-CoA synthetase (AMP-forming)/AMP-acid ligase II